MLAKLRTQRFDTFAYWPMAYPALANFAQPPDIGRRSREVFGSLIRSVTADRTHLSLDRAVQSPKVAAQRRICSPVRLYVKQTRADNGGTITCIVQYQRRRSGCPTSPRGPTRQQRTGKPRESGIRSQLHRRAL